MKKLFLAIYFIALSICNAAAKPVEISDAGAIPKPRMQDAGTIGKVKPISEEAMEDFLLNRIESAVIVTEEDIKDANTAINTVHSPEAIAAMEAAKEESNKSTFDKIYEAAINRVSYQEQNQATREDIVPTTVPTQNITEQRRIWDEPTGDVINILLPPNDVNTMVPAREHIPYLFTTINILPNEMVSFNQTIMVVSNGEKLKKGLTLVLPKFIYSKTAERQKVEYTINSVMINDQEVKYRMQEEGNRILLVPTEDYELEPGVYRYDFKFIADRILWNYADFSEFYWDVTGSSWNLVIARAGAAIYTPFGATPLSQEIYTGYPDSLDTQRGVIVQEDDGSYGFGVMTPLFIGEGMHIVSALPMSSVTPPSVTRRALWMISDYGDIIFTFLGLLTILISYLISWKFMKKNTNQLKFRLRKNAQTLRYLSEGKFDRRAFGAFLLELYRKNLIDIQQSGETILLIKRTDNLRSLDPKERKAVDQLFPGQESVLNINDGNMLKIRRAYKLVEQDTVSKIKQFIVKLNSGYLFFSILMLLTAEFFAAINGVSWQKYFMAMLICTAAFGVEIWWISLSFKRFAFTFLSRAAAIICLILTFVILCAFIAPLAALFILLSLYTIKSYTGIYSQKNGLLKPHILEAKGQRDYLIRSKENIMLGRDFTSQQANIFAVEAENEFPPQDKFKDYYKLDIAKAIIDKL